MKANELPPVELLRAMFDYDPETGIVTRRVTSGGRKVGEVAGSVNKIDGYRRIRVRNRLTLASRICWALHHGFDPIGYEIDHIDRNPDNNRIANLRLVTRSGNNRNREKKVASTGHRHITQKLCKGHIYYVVRIYDRYIGQRKTIEEAVKLRDQSYAEVDW
jgi:hypothetical protein